MDVFSVFPKSAIPGLTLTLPSPLKGEGKGRLHPHPALSLKKLITTVGA